MSNANITVPQCSAHVSAGQYTDAAQANFDLTKWEYYKTYVTSTQVLPGIIIGGLCWVAALVFIVWLLTLCCRSVGWRSRRTRVHDAPANRRNSWAVFNVLTTIFVLGVIGTGTWALIEGLKSTDGKVDDFWTLVDSAKVKLQSVSDTVANTTAPITDLQTSATAATTLLQNNQAIATAGGIDVPAALAALSTAQNALNSGQSGVTEAVNNIQSNGILKIENLQNNGVRSRTIQAQNVWRVLAVALFFGLLILFGVLSGFLAVLDRTPRLTATSTLFLWIWTGFVLLLGAGVLSLVWRVGRDSCLYGEDFVATKIGGGGNTATVINYYFGRVTIPPQDVSQELFKFNLTDIQAQLNSTDIQTLLADLQTAQGQALVATASPADQTAINALSTRISVLSSQLSSVNGVIQASNFASIVTSVKSLICCSLTNALWNLWLASIVTGAVAAVLAVLCTVKVVAAISPLSENRHYTVQSPNGAITKGGQAIA